MHPLAHRRYYFFPPAYTLQVVAVILAVLFAASAYAQTTNFFALAKSGNAQAVQAAVNKGVDLEARDKNGWTALMVAAANNPNPEVITTLFRAGAKVNARGNDGDTALMHAANINQNPEVITTLLQAGADVKAKDSGGRTALDYAKGNEALNGTDALRQLEEASK